MERSTTQIYEPREDTLLMIEALSRIDLLGKEILDMGTGSGVLATFCAQRGAGVTAIDINEIAASYAKRAAHHLGLDIHVLRADLFSSVRGKFDIILFNPPYLASESIEDVAVDGGREGREVIDRFLSQITGFLAEDGFCLLLVSSLNDPDDLKANFPHLLFEARLERSLFFEKLIIFKVSRRF
jgi:release factor glutamine methyltransferase